MGKRQVSVSLEIGSKYSCFLSFRIRRSLENDTIDGFISEPVEFDYSIEVELDIHVC